MGEKSCSLIAWQTKSGAFTLRFFCSQHFIFLFQHTEYVAIAIRFASCLPGFPCGKPARIISQSLYTLDANHPIGFGQPRLDTRPSATLQGCSSGRRLLRGCFPRGT